MTNQELNKLAKEHFAMASKDMEKVDEGFINNCLLNLRESCLKLIISEVSSKNQSNDLDLENPHRDFKNALTATLPKIILSRLVYKSEFSLISLIILSLILFLIGCGLGEGIYFILNIQESILINQNPEINAQKQILSHQNNVLVYLLGIITAFLFLLGQKSEKFSQKFDDFYINENLIKAKSIPKKLFKRIFWRKIMLILMVIGFVVWDFFHGLPSFYIFRYGLAEFLTYGKILPMIFNPYGIGFIILALTLISKRKKFLDKTQMEIQICTALVNWYPNALNYAKSIYQDKNEMVLDKDLARNLISVANVLPADKQMWYGKMLEQLGLEAYSLELNQLDLPKNYETSPFAWKEEFLTYFDKYDHIKIGDHCFVDTSPIWKNGQLLTKGLVRKVR